MKGVCAACATAKGATWPVGHLATFWIGPCCECEKDQGVCEVTEYKWPSCDVLNEMYAKERA